MSSSSIQSITMNTSKPVKRCYWTIHLIEWLKSTTEKFNFFSRSVVYDHVLRRFLFAFYFDLFTTLFSFLFAIFFFLIFRLFSLTQFDIFTSPVYGLTPFFVVVLTLIVVWICHADGNLYLYRTINFIWLTSTDVKQSMLTSVSHFVGARIKGDIWWEGDQYNNRKKKKQSPPQIQRLSIAIANFTFFPVLFSCEIFSRFAA